MSDWISIDPLPQMPTPTQEYIKEQLAAGQTPQAIAHRLHLRADHVTDEIYEIRKKECTMGKTLTEEQKAKILEMRGRGMSYHSIAMAVGCAAQSAANVCNAEKLKAELAAEQAADLPKTQEAPENLPEKKAAGKPGKINGDFDAAVNQMIAEAEKDTVKGGQYESEDTLDTYQGTFSASAENKSTIAEKNSTNAEKQIVSDCIVERVPDSIIRTTTVEELQDAFRGFNAAVDQMIADAEVEKNTLNAEKNSTNAEKPKKQYEKPIVSDCIVERVPDSIIRTVKLRLRSICEEIGRNVAEVDRLRERTDALASEATELTQWVEAHL